MLESQNLSTIAVWIFTLIAPWVSAYITQEAFTTIFVSLVGIILAIYSSKNPNDIKALGNDTSEDENIVDEFEDGVA